jgi:ribonuclease H / adenosylcobalamin/alpha-ribazole phosphatase
MTLCLLARHARHSQIECILMGRKDRGPLSAEGRNEAAELAARAGRLAITGLKSSPRQRALETAAIVAKATGLAIQVCPELDEIDFGSWTGRSFSDLQTDPAWRQWNAERGQSRPPQGESMAEAQQRIVNHLRRLHSACPNGRVLMLSHAEPIRAAVLHYMSLPLDDWSRLEIPPVGLAEIKMRANGRALVSVPSRIATGMHPADAYAERAT